MTKDITLYCSTSGKMIKAKSVGDSCSYNYQCESSNCKNNVCVQSNGCLSGCMQNSQCYPTGTVFMTGAKYCSPAGTLSNLKNNNAGCSYGYECLSSNCQNNICTTANPKANLAPRVSAGNPIYAYAGEKLNITGIVSDDGKPSNTLVLR